MTSQLIDMTGQQFGSLFVLERLPNRRRQSRWSCVCHCGNRYVADGYKLRTGMRKSCGCRGIGERSAEVDRLVAEYRDRPALLTPTVDLSGIWHKPGCTLCVVPPGVTLPANPRRISRGKYTGAQARINSGYWTIDVDEGRLFRASTGKELNYRITEAGYRTVSVPIEEGWARHAFLHRVIWEAVHGEIPDGMELNHLNCDKSCNGIANLELCTRQANMAHASANGLLGPRIGHRRDVA